MITQDPIILLVDDSETDVLLMRTVFERAGLIVPLQFACDGVDAIAYLEGEGQYSDRIRFPMPTIVLLDLNMPRKNGFEVLEWVRQQPALRPLRIYVLSASNRPDDIRRAYDLGANSYLVKPGTLDGLMKMAKMLIDWLRSSHFAPLVEIAKNHVSVSTPPFVPRPDSSPANSFPPFATGNHGPAPGQSARNGVHRLTEDLELRFMQQNVALNLLRIERENLVRLISHDAGTPLMTIGGYVDLLLQDDGPPLDEKSRQHLQKIKEATDRLTQMLAAAVDGLKAAPLSRRPMSVGIGANSAA